jgi:hypothetical protein
MRKRYLYPLLALLGMVSACAPKTVEELARQELFTLGVGKMDNQLDLFQVNGYMADAKNRVYMRDGLFYIANGNSAKIVELSSYGDLIFMLYNPELNPEPVSFRSPQAEGVSATKMAVPYPLSEIGELVVDSDKRLYVEDVVPEERRVEDKQLGVLLDRVVLRFDRHGKLLDFIGQEGIGGTPFPYIDSLYMTEGDELVVICRTPERWHVFWYSPSGALLYQVDVDQEHLPELSGRPKAVATLGKILPDLSAKLLYLLVYYHTEPGVEAAESSREEEQYACRIYSLDLGTGRYERYVEVPSAGTRKEKVGTMELEVPVPSFELLGVSARGAFYLLRREDANLFLLLVMDRSGREMARRYMVIEDSELTYRQLGLSHTGIVYGLLVDSYSARAVWWRSDRLIKEPEYEGG